MHDTCLEYSTVPIYHLEHSLAELVVWAFSIGVCMYVYNLFYTLFELRIIYIWMYYFD